MYNNERIKILKHTIKEIKKDIEKIKDVFIII